MWLLSTDSLKLVYFDRVDKIKGGYAILSHVWDDSEQSFQDIQKLHSEGVSYDSIGGNECSDHSDGASQDLENRTPLISNKILGCVKAAKGHGFHWLWIDACCIDKTSSAELSEAINSMFSWYEKASVCYAYLKDVTESCVLDSPDSAFRKSRWFIRGWTLQELIAPRCLVFLSSEWTSLGTKALLTTLLSEITGVDVEVLTFRRELQQVSVARRMSWASKRETTRDEDQAYSLMGIFGITMPTIYGEGFNAFRRLQEEIMKQSTDQTLFAWGEALPPYACRGRLTRNIINPAGSLLAPSPRSFAASANYRPIPPSKIADAAKGIIHIEYKDIMTNPDFAITSAGVRCQLLTVDFKPFTLALLACQTATGECIGLLLHQRRDVQSDRPHYLVGAVHDDISASPGRVVHHPAAPQETESPRLYRLLYIESSTLAALLARHRVVAHGSGDHCVVGVPRKIYISRDLSFLPPHPWMRLLEPEPQEVYLPTWVFEQSERLGFTCPDWLCERTFRLSRLPLSCQCENAYTGEAFTIYVERVHMWLCVSVSIYPNSHLAPSHYPAYKSHSEKHREPPPRAFEEDSLGDGTHPSSLQHCVRYWPNGLKTFGDADRTIRISCTRRTTGDQSQYCLDFVLEGGVYVPHASDSRTGSNWTARQRHAARAKAVPSRGQRRVTAQNTLSEELEKMPYSNWNLLNVRRQIERNLFNISPPSLGLW